MSKRHMIKSKGIFIKRIYLLPLFLTAWLTWGNSMAQKPDLTGVEIVTHRVRDNIYMLEATKDVAGNMKCLRTRDMTIIMDLTELLTGLPEEIYRQTNIELL